MKTTKRTKCVSALAVGLCLAAGASAYDLETTLSVSDNDNSDPSYQLGVRYYFAPINHGSSTPWDEVSFVERIGYVDGTGLYTEQSRTVSNMPGVPPLRLEHENEFYAGRLVYRTPDSPHMFTLGLGYGESSSDTLVRVARWITGFPSYIVPPTEDFHIAEVEQNQYSYSAGYHYYIDRLWTAGTEIVYDERPFADVYNIALATDRLWDLGTGRWAGAKASVAYERTDMIGTDGERWKFALAGRYYFNPKTGVHAGISLQDQFDERALTVGVSRYLNDFLFVRLDGQYRSWDFPFPSGPDDDEAGFKLSFGGRF